MRLIILAAAAALACVLATTAQATVRPINAQDRALLARPATSEEQIAEQVARRLTGHKAAAVRCGPIGESSSNALGVTPGVGVAASAAWSWKTAQRGPGLASATQTLWAPGSPAGAATSTLKAPWSSAVAAPKLLSGASQ